MKTELYKGRKLKTLKGKEYGYVQHSVNGESLGRHMGTEDSALDYMKRTVDFADEVGVGSGRMGAKWYAPGTYELCEHEHAMEIGGQCGHSYCVEQRPTVVTETPADELPPLADEATTIKSVDEYLSREFPLLFPATDVDEPADDVDTDTVIRATTFKSSTGAAGLVWGDPTDGLATVNAWAHRAQSGIWTVDGTTVAVRTDDHGHIRGAVIVLETPGSKFPEPAGG